MDRNKAMKKILVALAPALLLAACSGASDAPAGAGGGASVNFTHYSDLTEVFAEHRPLVVGKDRRFDAHLSWVADYRAVDSGTLTVELVHPDGSIDKGSAGVSETPGIFRVLVKASKTGKPQLRLTLVSKGKTSVHNLGPVEVYATRELAEKANPEPPENPNRIAFSKEVQWKIPFLTAPATSGDLAETIPVLIDVRFAPDAEAVIAAPVAGIIRTGGNFPVPGSSVRQGQQLATLSAQLGAGEDVASLDLGIAQARIAADAVRRDLARLQGLYAQEAVPLRRLQEAQTNLRIAEAQLAASSRRRGSLAGGGAGVPIVSPISGLIVSSTLVRGSPVQAGAELMRIGNPNAIWLVARVPEAMAAKIGAPGGLDIKRFDEAEALIVGQQLRLVSSGRFVDPATRTMEVVFASIGANGFKPGSRLSGRLRTGNSAQSLAVPAAAVIEEGGQTVVYVQVAGETFERRIVARGTASGNLVAITGDVKPGERVVILGAAAVRAAAATPDAFGHGHAH
jgi:membrane fusion protein, heavy metal efflux system